MSKYFTLKIQLTQTTISVSVIDEQNKQEEIIELIPKIKEYPINIEFNKNEIIVCQQNKINKNTFTNFVQDLFDYPDQFTKYSFIYQQKQFEVLPETLLTLIVYQFKKKVDQKGIVNNFILETPNGTNPEIIHRIKSALWNINIPNEYTPITKKYMIRPREDLYVDEEYMVYEIIEKEESYQKFIREINRAKEIINTTENEELKQKAELINQIIDYNEFYTPDNYQKLKLQFTCKEREILKLHHLDDNYCLFISSQYFNTIDDFKNLEMTCKRLNGTTYKFKYNPISITEEEYNDIFPNIETYHLYKRGDKMIQNENIKRYVDWFTQKSYQERINKMKENEKEIEYKNVIFTSEDRTNEIHKMQNNHFIVPFGVKEIGEYCFNSCSTIKEIAIPHTVTKLGNYCFLYCYNLTKIDLNENIKELPEGSFSQCLCLKEITIPTSVTKLGDYCFDFCYGFTKIELNGNIKEIPYQCFYNCKNLKEIRIPQSVTKLGNYCFEKCSNLTKIEINDNLQEIGDNCFNKCSNIKEIRVPNSVTKLGDCCFNECTNLTTIELSENIREIPNGCFNHCSNLKEVSIPKSITKLGDHCFFGCCNLNKIEFNEILNEIGNSTLR